MNAQRFGCSTYCLISQSLEDALEAIYPHTRIVEILSDAGHDLFQHHEICDSFPMRYAVHAPTADINLASDNERMRRASIEVISKLSVICDNIGAINLVIHPGYSLESRDRMHAKRALERSIVDLSNLQKDRNVCITIENMGSWDVVFFRSPKLIPILEEYGLGFTLDIGHASVNGCLDDFLSLGSPVHTHLHDNDGSWDAHDACGQGTIDFCHVFRSLPRNTMNIIEVSHFSRFLQSVEYLNSIEG